MKVLNGAYSYRRFYLKGEGYIQMKKFGMLLVVVALLFSFIGLAFAMDVSQDVPSPELSITSATNYEIFIGKPVNIFFAASKPNAMWNIGDGELPPGLNLNNTNGVLTGTVTEAGTFSFSISANADGQIATAQMTLNVTEARDVSGDIPQQETVDISPSFIMCSVGEPISVTLSAPDGLTVTNWDFFGLPSGLNIDSTNRVSGIPTVSGEYRITVTLNTNDGEQIGYVIMRVASPSGGDGSDSDFHATVGMLFTLSLDHVPGATWRIADGVLPPGLSLNNDGMISGTPNAAGHYTFTVTAQTEEEEQSFALTLIVDSPSDIPGEGFIVSSDSNFNVAVGESVSFTLIANLPSTSGDVNVRWQVTGGSLPPGLILSESGSIFGTPTGAGTYTFTVNANDAQPITITLTIEGIGEASSDIPVPPSGNPDSQTSLEAESKDTKTEDIVVVEKAQVDVTVQSYTQSQDEAKVVKTVTKEESKQTVDDATSKVQITATEQTTMTITTVLENAQASGGTVTTSTLVNELLNTTTDTSDTDTSAQDSSAAIAASLLKGANNTGDSGNIANLTGRQRTGESLADTLIRLVRETTETATRVLTSKNTANRIKTIAGTTTLDVKQATDLQSATTTKTVTDEAGETSTITNDEAVSANDAALLLAQQAAQAVQNAGENDTSAAQRQRELQSQIPIAVVPPVTPLEPGIYMMNLPTFKKNTYKKPIQWHTIKTDRRTNISEQPTPSDRGALPNIFAFAPVLNGDTESAPLEDGEAIFLNSIGQQITVIPGEDEWGVPDDNPGGEPQVIIPGYVTAAAYLEPNVDYMPVITVTAESLDVATSSDTKEVEVTQERVQENVVIPVFENNAYSTSFDTDSFSNYNTNIGMFIITGSEGTIEANREALSPNEVIVQTLPKLRISGDNASIQADYVLKVSLDIPLNTDNYKLAESENVNDILNFYPRNLNEVEGTAIFLNSDGKTLTSKDIYAVASGEAGRPSTDNTRVLIVYIVMRLEKSEDDYEPVITVRLEPNNTMEITASSDTLQLTVGRSSSITLTPSDAEYSCENVSGLNISISGSTVTFNATRSGTYTVTITGRNTRGAEGSITITVRAVNPTVPESEDPPEVLPGSQDVTPSSEDSRPGTSSEDTQPIYSDDSRPGSSSEDIEPAPSSEDTRPGIPSEDVQPGSSTDSQDVDPNQGGGGGGSTTDPGTSIEPEAVIPEAPRVSIQRVAGTVLQFLRSLSEAIAGLIDANTEVLALEDGTNATVGVERDSLEPDELATLPEDQTPAAILPIISVNRSAIYMFSVSLTNLRVGVPIFWHPMPSDNSVVVGFIASDEDDEENAYTFLDDNGEITKVVPSSQHVTVAAYMEAGKTYAPVITTSSSGSGNVDNSGGNSGSGGDNSGENGGGNEDPTTGDSVGSSGGGCDVGISFVGLLMLGGLIVTRHRK